MERLRLTARHRRPALACLSFALVCIPLAASGNVSWIWVACGLLMTSAFAVERRPDDFVDELVISDTSVTRHFGQFGGEKQSESVAWGDVQRIVIRTADSGIEARDFYYMLFGSGSNGVIVTEDVARRQDFLRELEARFPSFDHRAFVEATACRFTNAFTVWERTPEHAS